jgi:hypothetical protein
MREQKWISCCGTNGITLMRRRLLGDTPHVRRRAPTTVRDKAKALRDIATKPPNPTEHAYGSLVAAIREMLEQVLDERDLSGRVDPV